MLYNILQFLNNDLTISTYNITLAPSVVSPNSEPNYIVKYGKVCYTRLSFAITTAPAAWSNVVIATGIPEKYAPHSPIRVSIYDGTTLASGSVVFDTTGNIIYASFVDRAVNWGFLNISYITR